MLRPFAGALVEGHLEVIQRHAGDGADAGKDGGGIAVETGGVHGAVRAAGRAAAKADEDAVAKQAAGVLK